MFAAILRRACTAAVHDQCDGAKAIEALAPFKAPDNSSVWHDDRALLVHALHWNTPSSIYERSPELCPRTGRHIVSWARLDNREDLCAALQLENREQLSDPQIILAAYQRWSRACASHLEGDFSFVIYDPIARSVYCARDAMGAKPFYYCDTRDRFVAASSPAAIRVAPGVRVSLNRNWIALFAAGLNFADEETGYNEIIKLPPGHYLTIEGDGPITVTRYSEFDLEAPHANRRDRQWVDMYREVFDRAVDDRARSRYAIGAESSAGLDSASIVGRLVEILQHDLARFHTFSVVGHQREADLLEELARHCALVSTHRVVRPKMLELDAAVERACKVIGHPPEHSQPLLNTRFFEYCETFGIRTMMSGYGGDEIVTSQARHLIEELLERRAFGALAGELDRKSLPKLLRLIVSRAQGRSVADEAGRSLADRILAFSCISREFLEDSGLRVRIERWMAPERLATTLNEVAVKNPAFRHGRGGRLEASALIASTYGIEYRFPMFDRRLVQYFLSVPSIEKRKRTLGRYLHRRAVAGRVPDSIVWQPTKDMGPPLGGEFSLAALPKMAFCELPETLRDVFDPAAFDALQHFCVNEGAPQSERLIRGRYFFWQVQQLCDWIEDGSKQ